MPWRCGSKFQDVEEGEGELVVAVDGLHDEMEEGREGPY